MILISHRGNINGENPERENHPDYIKEALDKGYHVEIDLWVENAYQLSLGHDRSQYKIFDDFLCNDKLFIHCKNIAALIYLTKPLYIENYKCDFFYHENDKAALTFKNKIWEYPRYYKKDDNIKNSIIVMPELNNIIDENIFKNAYGICSDVIEEYKELI